MHITIGDQFAKGVKLANARQRALRNQFLLLQFFRDGDQLPWLPVNSAATASSDAKPRRPRSPRRSKRSTSKNTSPWLPLYTSARAAAMPACCNTASA
ncbi:Uncharacterised protein [Ewingella americana]|uniref:Uncharacterized protein n=1 Tax=Ewingella americana TaxID=41202 RepID=A0A377NKB2_9GAMM|nr:Uncharacterised protein [Ewingella americana]